MKYRVQWHYKSSYGALERGGLVELDEEQAATFNRDSPGVLVLETEAPPESTAPAEPHDRQQRARKDRQGDPSDQGAITRVDFLATRKRGR